MNGEFQSVKFVTVLPISDFFVELRIIFRGHVVTYVTEKRSNDFHSLIQIIYRRLEG